MKFLKIDIALQEALIEEFGLLLETNLELSPLTASIYALLVVSGSDGVTFDNIKHSVKASKSSVSTSIKMLLQLNHIEFHTKIGDRKRYFKPSRSYLQEKIKKQMRLLEAEVLILNKFNSFNKINHP